MRVDQQLEQLRRGPLDAKALGKAGRALGDELPRQRLDVLARFRAGLARLAADDAYAAGYLRALTDVSAAFEAAVGEAQGDAELTAEVARRPAWRSVLAATEEEGGAVLPSKLAVRLGMDKGQITNVFKELRALELVELSSDTSDKRQRPQRVTGKGRAVLAALGEPSPLVREVARRGMAVVAALVERGPLPRAELAQVVGAEGPPGLLDAVLAACDEAELILPEDERVSWVEPRDRRHYAAMVAWFGLSPDQQDRHPLGQRLAVLRGSNVPLVVITDVALRSQWQLYLGERGFPGGSRVITRSDFLVGALDLPEAYNLLVDDVSLMRQLEAGLRKRVAPERIAALRSDFDDIQRQALDRVTTRETVQEAA